jgi:hypothetical protein
MVSSELNERPLLAEDCLLPGFCEGPLLRKLPLRLIKSAAIADPKPTSIIRTTLNVWYPFRD